MTVTQAVKRPQTSPVSEYHSTLEAMTSNGTLIDPAETFRLPEGYAFSSGADTFTIEKALGQGGEALSYRAHNADGKKKVIKIYRETNGGNLHEKLAHELLRVNTALKTTADLIKVNSIDHAVVRDYVEGMNLAEFVEATKRRFTAQEAAEFLLQIARTQLSPLHDEHLVHNDIKPQNIIVDEKEGKRVYTLIDFGLLHEEGPIGTRTMISPQGTLGYSHLLSTKHEQSDDIYALAETTYFLFTGNDPKPEFDELADKLDDDQKVSRMPISEEFKATLRKMYGHASKYATTKELIHDLEKLSESNKATIDLASARRIETVRSKEKPSEALLQEIKGIEAIFQTEYAGVKFARDKPLDQELLARLTNVLGKLHYEKRMSDNANTVFVRKRLHEGKNEAFIIHHGQTAYFTHVVTEKDNEFTRPQVISEIPKQEDAYYVGKQVGRLAVPAIGAGVALGIGALTVGPTMLLGATALLGAGIGAGLNLVGTAFYAGDGNSLDSRESIGVGFIPGGQHHLIGKATEYVARHMEWNRHREHRRQGNVLEDALTAVPLYEYD